MGNMDSILNSASIVCKHIVRGDEPIPLAQRDEPVEPEDSGWQFLCDSGKEETVNDAKIWLTQEVLDFEPSLKKHILPPIGTVLIRDENNNWIIRP